MFPPPPLQHPGFLNVSRASVSPDRGSTMLFNAVPLCGNYRLMDAEHLVSRLRRDACAIEAAWEAEHNRHGRGALVFFLLNQQSPEDDAIECRYWTLEDVRALLRELGREDEFAYRWIFACEERGGLPLIIVSRPQGSGPVDLCFHYFQTLPD